jgi:MoxR-like ATPase
VRQVESIEDLERLLASQRYIADRSLALSIYLALKLRRPLFLEGEAGVGKTEVAKALADAMQTELVRLQCYEGLDVTHALYEWNYPRQLLEIRMLEASHALDHRATGESADVTRARATERLFTEPFLIKRPLLKALTHEPGEIPVLLIDEIDRADEEFEGFLLELLSDFQVTIPELGTITADEPPIVILTSNRTREIHDALKRRCLYYWIPYPSFEKEYQIIMSRIPETPRLLGEQVAAFVQELRGADLHKMAGISETLDWIAALVALDQRQLDETVVEDTLGILLKDHDDIEAIRGDRVRALVADARLKVVASRR